MGGRPAVVTGGAGGIGRAICLRLARLGHRVVALGRDEQRLGALEREARAAGLTVVGHRCDITDEAQVAEVIERLGTVEILVNNAGIATSAPVHRTSLADWEEHLRVNATAAFLLTQAVLPGMRDNGWGRIVAIASTAARAGVPYTAAYSASKHALLGLTRVVAAEVAGSGVTSNAVCPTFVRTPMTERSVARISARTGRDAAAAEAALAGAAPLGRLLEPDEVAAAVEYLTSEDAGSVNGQTLVLDGGGLQA
ncbi:MAG TPA: SDR family NAD(P)-dependent oxidoreductase [Streptosporangiaceae bacterium]|nr:SDR family NAD(P)-dependent oxidoreductase [Streptosporangiaceae bacterium]